LNSGFEEHEGQFSPDGQWVAYHSNASGRFEVYVRHFPKAEGQEQISTSGGIQPRWRPDGKELYYLAPDGSMMAAPIAVKGTTLEAGAPVQLFQPRIVGGGTEADTRQQYDVAANGLFLINAITNQASAAPITIILNWTGAQK